MITGKNSRYLLLLAALLVVPCSSFADSFAQLKQKYAVILERNPFGLKPPTPRKIFSPRPKPKPKIEIFLTGITTIGYPRVPKFAYIMTREQGKDPTYYRLQAGQKRDEIAVVSIDEKRKTVRIRTSEGDSVLSFKTHGVPGPAPKVQLVRSRLARPLRR